jgi:hypothetical protein
MVPVEEIISVLKFVMTCFCFIGGLILLGD